MRERGREREKGLVIRAFFGSSFLFLSSPQHPKCDLPIQPQMFLFYKEEDNNGAKTETNGQVRSFLGVPSMAKRHPLCSKTTCPSGHRAASKIWSFSLSLSSLSLWCTLWLWLSYTFIFSVFPSKWKSSYWGRENHKNNKKDKTIKVRHEQWIVSTLFFSLI